MMTNDVFRLIIVPLLIIFFVGFSHADERGGEADIVAPNERVQAPEFQLPGLSGSELSLGQYNGQVVLLTFWASWCVPCKKEMPSLQRLYDEYSSKGLTVLSVAADRGGVAPVQKFVDDRKITFPVLLDPEGNVRDLYEVIGLPMSYLIGQDGKISARVIGSRTWDSPKSIAFIKGLLGE